MFNLNLFYKVLGTELLTLGIHAKDKPAFMPNQLSDSLKVTIADMDALINDFSGLGIDLVAHANKNLSYELVTDFKDQIYALSNNSDVEVVNQRKYYLDLAIKETKKTYIQYAVEQIRLNKVGYKNCLVMAEDFINYEIVDCILDSMNPAAEYEALDNGDVAFYDKGIRYNVMQSSYSKALIPNTSNKISFIFYDKLIASLIYNSKKNNLNKIDTTSSVHKNRLEFFYELDFAKHQVIQIEVPIAKK